MHKMIEFSAWLFFNVDPGIREFIATLSLFTNKVTGTPFSSMSTTLNLYRRPLFIYVPILRDTNSESNVELSTLLLLLEYQIIVAGCMYNNTPECKLWVSRYSAWLTSTFMVVCTYLPIGLGMFGGSCRNISGHALMGRPAVDWRRWCWW